jgi:hypothetical protein
VRTITACLVAALLAVCIVGCSSGPPLRVTTIQLGRSVNEDHTVASFTTTFAPDETVYLSVLTTGVGSGTISARWKYGSAVINEPKRDVNYRIDAVTDFKLQSGGGGFPTGDYSVEVFLNGQSAGTRTFSVQNPR